jgi:hypothetical protein
VDYDAGGKKWEVTFDNDKATNVQEQGPQPKSAAQPAQ